MHLKNRQLRWENSPWCCRRGRQRLSQVKTSTQMVVGHSFCLLPHMWKRAKKFCFPESGQQESGMRSKWKLGQPLTRNLFTIWHQAPISGHQELINYSRVLFIEIKRSSENPVHTRGPSAAMTHYWNRGYRGATERETTRSGGQTKWKRWWLMINNVATDERQGGRSGRFDPKAGQSVPQHWRRPAHGAPLLSCTPPVRGRTTMWRRSESTVPSLSTAVLLPEETVY